jgi:hypothetical protein
MLLYITVWHTHRQYLDSVDNFRKRTKYKIERILLTVLAKEPSIKLKENTFIMHIDT